MVSVGTKAVSLTFLPSPTAFDLRSSPPSRRRRRQDPSWRRRWCVLLAVGSSAAALLAATQGLILFGNVVGVDYARWADPRGNHLLRSSTDEGWAGTTTHRRESLKHPTTNDAGVVTRKIVGVRGPADARTNETVASKDQKKKNAYSFLVSGCDPDQPWRCRPYLMGVAVSIHALQSYGSASDFHVYVELLHGSNRTTLPPEDEALVVAACGATLHYIPPDPQQSYYRSQLFKFLILNLTQYEHVFYLDADVLPLSNLDYLFEAMDRNVLRRNVVFLGGIEPANGGGFILSPRDGALRLAHDIILRKERARKWNSTVGWGVDSSTEEFAFPTNDVERQSTWSFFGSDGDQGLLYYWTKFVERDVSLISSRGKVWHWKGAADDALGLPPPVITSDSDPKWLPTLLGNSSEPSLETAIRAAGIHMPPGLHFPESFFSRDHERPRRDFFHYHTPMVKAWSRKVPGSLGPDTRLASLNHYWYSLLSELNERHHLGLDFAPKGVPLAPLQEDQAGTTPSSSSSYEILYGQRSRTDQVFTRLIRDGDDENDRDKIRIDAYLPAVKRQS